MKELTQEEDQNEMNHRICAWDNSGIIHGD